MRLFLLLISLIFLAVQRTVAFSGVDISSGSDVPFFQCVKNAGFDFAIVRAYESIGQVDPNGPHSVYNARDAGIEYVDVYLFPCFSCGNGAGQAVSMVNYLKSYNANYGMVWLDIEGPGTYWSSNQGANQAFFNELVSGLESVGAHIGIYTSESQWEPIMGDWSGGAKYPLWYAHYDGNPSFSDFSPFAGWSSPAIKQYNDQGLNCGVGADLNWYP
ncbi:hypothetical protein DICPUDRAFT_88463 [Dictyostelium purpureum]|uniref:lysozyme n=1 Tax=Dictyostelium purpureum TaxID=5786 RepID=F0ZPJ0_DICPU|nr:uncharacterized protein DICPUDRAFT_88463 [Dictyostelium purpureum]EGC34142.1 hypothetical protein DICPUDRAFT_88463 [Dictyostelium purpureum]|eukprot:XP_003289340.1 hypothetical protein DICPUDRAFT_88463 [Dictyostelium purpureum]